MNSFFDDTMQGLLEAVEIKKGNISLIQKDDIPAATFTHSTSLQTFCNILNALGYGLVIEKKTL